MFTVKSTAKDFPKNTGKKYKVIINAGGGLFGYVITNFMSYLDFDLYSKVDCVAGTSIGGILTLAYCCTNDYKWVNDLFSQGGPKIFEDKNLLYGICASKYDNDNLKKFLQQIYQQKKFSDINKIAEKVLHTIITVMDFTLSQPRIFENINLKPQQDMKLVDLGLYTSAAPTYFNPHNFPWRLYQKYDPNDPNVPLNQKILLLKAAQYQLCHSQGICKNSSVLVDGGVLENIPVISTYTTLHNELGVQPKDIDMFVIGTGNFNDQAQYTAQDISKWSLIDYALKMIVPYVTSSNQQMSIFWGLQMGFNSFTYYNPINGQGQMDDAKILPRLKEDCLKHKDQFLQEINEFLQK